MDSPKSVVTEDVRNPELDGLRGLAFFLVLLVHPTPPSRETFNLAYAKFSIWGVAGVDLFFVLSGFLITGILLRARQRPNYYGRFYARRSLRIFPLYFTTLIIALIVIPLIAPSVIGPTDPVYRNQAWLWVFAANFPMCYDGGVFTGHCFNLTHLWSLAIEEQFYLAWPFFVRRLSPRQLAWLCLALAVAGAVARIAIPLVTKKTQAVYFFSFCRFDAIAAGALVAIAVSNGSSQWRTLTRRMLGLISAATLGWLAFVRLKAQTGDQYYWPSLHFAAPFAIAGLGCYLIMAAIDAPQRSSARVFLRMKPLRYLGKYSYALYVFHAPVIAQVKHLYPVLAAHLGAGPFALIVYLITNLALTLLLAVISWRFLEAPFLRLKDRLFASTLGMCETGNLESTSSKQHGTSRPDSKDDPYKSAA